MNSIERLRQFVEEDLIYQAYKKRNGEPNKGFERQCFVHCRDIENVLEVLDEIRECAEQDCGMYEIIKILDKVGKK